MIGIDKKIQKLVTPFSNITAITSIHPGLIDFGPKIYQHNGLRLRFLSIEKTLYVRVCFEGEESFFENFLCHAGRRFASELINFRFWS